MDKEETKYLTAILYWAIGIATALGLLLLFYWNLRLDSSIASFINNTRSEPWYFWPYLVLTAAAIVLFGFNAALLAYRVRRFGLSPFKQILGKQSGTSLGALFGIAASACPVCGSVLLSLVGITGGLAAFPLGGLELKVISVAFLILPIVLTKRELKKFESRVGECPVPRDDSFAEKDGRWLRSLAALIILFGFSGWYMLKTDPIIFKIAPTRANAILNQNDNQLYISNPNSGDNQLFNEASAKVLENFQSKIYLGAAVVKLIENGVIDKEKFKKIYESRGGLPKELQPVLNKSSRDPILLTKDNANYYVNLLWPLGLANYMSTNKDSPVNGKSLFNFASTGGWNLGKENNGGKYFNRFRIVELTPRQEELATKIAKNTFRPCCNNSTFFQDCNHGSALLGLLELGVSQGLSENELYREALAFNSHWFPNNYIQTALYFKVVKNKDWENVDPEVVIGKDFSSISGWSSNVAKEIQRLGLVPQRQRGAGCGA